MPAADGRGDLNVRGEAVPSLRYVRLTGGIQRALVFACDRLSKGDDGGIRDDPAGIARGHDRAFGGADSGDGRSEHHWRPAAERFGGL